MKFRQYLFECYQEIWDDNEEPIWSFQEWLESHSYDDIIDYADNFKKVNSL